MFALFSDVENAAELRSAVVAGTVGVALVDASLVCSRRHVESATQQALRRSRPGNMVVLKANDTPKTRTLQSEFVYCLAPATSAGEALRTLGISDDTTNVLVARIGSDDNSEEFEGALKMVRGRRVAMERLDERTQAKDRAIAAHFKVGDDELAVSTLEAAVLSRIAVKDCL
ncbi:hypothetical protein CTAYLR_007005 [Chrysophaeum taylorii]|uniref:Kinase binding protein CGI-121 n=1 Tax=Chrysophaeum taylorii TaxID=2483200 RepID=A0AAD7XLY4_9STRA|nr:hypothetical protein CTAYLR_007005 [Chrysophaeum taylorii]